MSKPTLLLAKWLCPMDRPPIENGGVAIVGDRIAAVGSKAELQSRFTDAKLVDYDAAALLPGLINTHTHLELTNRTRLEFDGDIAGWLLRQRPPAGLTPEQHRSEVESATHAGINQCLRFGVTCVGDISQQPQWTRPILAKSPLRATSFGEVLGLGKFKDRAVGQIERAVDPTESSRRLRIGISPHAPYTVDVGTLGSCLATAVAGDLPLAMHIAEFAEEREFLAHQTGVFRNLWECAGSWTNDVQLAGESPIDLLSMKFSSTPLLEQGTLLAHVNYASDVEIKRLAQGRASVVFCPRTHAFFRHPPHRWREMITAGVNVAVGTDSCASSPDLNVVDDLRLLHQQYPHEAIDVIWSLVTTRAAAAMDQSGTIGSLTPRKVADVAVFPVSGGRPLQEILDVAECVPEELWIAGVRQKLR